MTGRRWRAAVGAAAVLLTGGCNFTGLYGVNLPGSAASSGRIYRVTAIFSDVMDLVPESSVRLNGVVVGSVQSISLTRDNQAAVLMRLPDSVRLPANAVAVLSQTSLLGEKYVALEPNPDQPPQGTLANGAVIPNGDTSQDASVEEVFSALAAVLNGGGIGQLDTISRELTKALHGRESQVHDLFFRLNTLVANLDADKTQIVRALTAVDNLSGQLAQQRQVLATALTDLAPGISVLADERSQLVGLLTGLSRLGQVSVQIIQASQQNTVSDLSSLQPILTQLAAAGTNLPHSLELLLDFPFPKNAQNAIPGDYTGLSVTVDSASFLRMLSGGGGLPPLPSSPQSSGTPTPTPTPTASGVPSLPSLPQLPGLATVPSVPSSTGSTSGLATVLLGGLA